jgi:peptidoglycan/LPS O-acetylase OafA/YrhL
MGIRARIRRILPILIVALPFILAACGPGGTTTY